MIVDVAFIQLMFMWGGKMTNKEKLMQLNSVDLYEMMIFLIMDYSKQNINSKLFMINWLDEQYDKNDWAWKGATINYERT